MTDADVKEYRFERDETGKMGEIDDVFWCMTHEGLEVDLVLSGPEGALVQIDYHYTGADEDDLEMGRLSFDVPMVDGKLSSPTVEDDLVSQSFYVEDSDSRMCEVFKGRWRLMDGATNPLIFDGLKVPQ